MMTDSIASELETREGLKQLIAERVRELQTCVGFFCDLSDMNLPFKPTAEEVAALLEGLAAAKDFARRSGVDVFGVNKS